MCYSILLPWILLMVMPVLCGTNISPTYRSDQTICDSNDDCDSDKMEVCWKLYDGCYHGVCMCNPNTHILDQSTGGCKISRSGNEDCSHDDMCLDTMACINNTCQCRYGELTPEGNFCLLPRHRRLGQQCNASTDICLQSTSNGYVSSDVWCRWGRCVCSRGLLKYETSCIRSRTTTCSRSYECEGGFICLHNECSCPHTYRPIAHHTKCAKENALIDLPLGSRCDEINEQIYCEAGLICHKCYSDRHHKCIKYSLSPTPDRAYLSTSSGSEGMHHNTWWIGPLLYTYSLYIGRLACTFIMSSRRLCFPRSWR